VPWTPSDKTGAIDQPVLRTRSAWPSAGAGASHSSFSASLSAPPAPPCRRLPAIAVAAVFAFFDSHNSVFAPLVYLNHPGHHTLALGVPVVEVHGTPRIATIVVYRAIVVLLLMVVFVFVQRQIVRGVPITGMR
jgi:hypothetical protein